MPAIGPQIRDPRTYLCMLCRVLQIWRARRRADSLSLAMDERFTSALDRLERVFILMPPRLVGEFLTFERQVGRGGFGTVFRARATKLGLETCSSLEKGKTYAVKHIVRRNKGPYEEAGRSLLATSVDRHVEFMNAFKGAAAHNCVHFIGIFLEYKGSMFQVMELLEGSDLFDFIDGRTVGIAERDAANLTKQMLTAIHYFHRVVGAIHRDIKPENFGFDKPVVSGRPLPTLKLFDFGNAFVLPNLVTESTAKQLRSARRAGTWLYMSPESWDGFTGPPSDVWAVALISYLLLSLQLPFGLLGRSGRACPWKVVREERLVFNAQPWSRISEAPQELLSLMLSKDSSARPTTTEALLDPWVLTASQHSHHAECGLDLDTRLEMPAKHSLTCNSDSQELWHSFMQNSERMASSMLPGSF